MYEVSITNNNVTTVISSGNNSCKKILGGTIKRELNAIDSFTFSISLQNKAWSHIKPFRTIVKVKNLRTGKYEFIGRPLNPAKEMSESGLFCKTFVCEGELAYLHDTVQRHGEYHNITPQKFLETILNAHNAQVPDNKKIYMGNCTVTNSTDNVYRYLTYQSSWDSIQQKLVGRLGGYLFLRYDNEKRYLDYLSDSGTTQTMPIKLAQNMKSIKQELKVSEVVTRLIPLGNTLESDDEEATDASRKRLDISSVNNGKDYLDDTKLIDEFGVIEGIQIWDDVNVASRLKDKGEQWLSNQHLTQSLDVSVLNLSLIDGRYSDFKLGNYYQTINQVAGIEETHQLISQEIDLFNVVNSQLTFGDSKLTLSKYQAQYNKEQDQINRLQSDLNIQNSKIKKTNEKLEKNNLELVKLQDVISDGESNFNQKIEDIMNLINAIEFPNVDELVGYATFNKFKLTQEEINDKQALINESIESRLLALEGVE